MIREWITIVLLIIGASFMLLASIGLLRLPDIYMRMHASTKAPTLGLLLILTALALFYSSFAVILKSMLIILFIFLTIPLAAHMIGRSAHLIKTPKWKNTTRDDLEKVQKDLKS